MRKARRFCNLLLTEDFVKVCFDLEILRSHLADSLVSVFEMDISGYLQFTWQKENKKSTDQGRLVLLSGLVGIDICP